MNRLLKRLCVLFGVIVVMLSCQADNFSVEEMKRNVTVDLSDFKIAKLDSLISSVEVVFLQNSPKSYLSGATKIRVVGNEYYVLDRSLGRVVIFGSKGQIVELIENKSEGPGSIFSIYDFDVNEFTNKIDLLDPYGRVVEYDRSNKSYSLKMDVSKYLSAFYGFINISSDVVAFYYSGEENLVYGYSIQKDEIIWTAIKNEGFDDNFQFAQSPPFFRSNGEGYFHDIYGQQLIRIHANGAEVKNSFDYGKNHFSFDNTTEAMLSDPEGIFQYLSESNYFYPVSNFWGSDEGLFAVGRYKQRRLLITFGNQPARKVALPDAGGFIPFMDYKEGFYYGVIQNLEEVSESLGSKVWNEVKGHIVDAKTIEYNPVIVKYEIK